MIKLFLAAATFALCAIVLFFVQHKQHSEVLTILAAICIGAALLLLVITLCVNAIFTRPLYD